jgi:hypothetical protein
MGRGKISEVEDRLGAPKTIVHNPDGIDWVVYENVGPVPGRVQFITNSRTGIVLGVSIFPEKITLVNIHNFFGPRFRVVRYKIDTCLTDGNSPSMYESESGPFEYILYEELGIAILAVGAYVGEIMYLDEPLGAKESQCARRPPSK